LDYTGNISKHTGIAIPRSQTNKGFLHIEDIVFLNENQLMFGDMMGLMKKVQQARARIEETKSQLDNQVESVKDTDGMMEVQITCNRVITRVELSEDAMNLERGEIQELIRNTVNSAISQASRINEETLQRVAREEMPSIPGMDQFFR
jgi:hypothetical protein